MADFELELELTARIDDLEKGMLDAQRAVEDSTNMMEQSMKDASEQGVAPFIEAIAKVAATLFLAEGALKIGAAAARGFSGDTESMVAALKSIPVFGPLITSRYTRRILRRSTTKGWRGTRRLKKRILNPTSKTS